ncbi:MAG TPA: class I SAM-dependent methyltransferase [Thermoleophilaceae bacterium]|nr:class I SAM-dependent methyltransferase [Thermoleophilaceae bacterium]
MDWSVGNYERTARQLTPAAEELIEVAAPREGERVVDVGCGTGNAALLAAARGARVTGVDPAPRLLQVARERASAEGLEADFVEGDGASIPLGDGEADLVLSVFGVIFAPDPPAALAELARVCAPDGRIVLTAWIPDGAISRMARVSRDAVTRALGTSPTGAPFPWHERDALAELLEPRGFSVTSEERSISFSGESPGQYLDAEAEHPLAVAARAVLEPRGEGEELRARMLEVLEAGNEDPHGFRVTSRYVITAALRGSASPNATR